MPTPSWWATDLAFEQSRQAANSTLPRASSNTRNNSGNNNSNAADSTSSWLQHELQYQADVLPESQSSSQPQYNHHNLRVQIPSSTPSIITTTSKNNTLNASNGLASSHQSPMTQQQEYHQHQQIHRAPPPPKLTPTQLRRELQIQVSDYELI